MLRAGMIRKLAAGIYNYLPLGYRVLNKLCRIIREEMNRAGAQELLLAALNPAELWRESGRWELYGPELMRLEDRHNRQLCLGPTHEEVITDLVRREVRSYRQLPLNLYQIQTKFRDEIRPRFGLIRGREFLMKDGYSFDRDDASVEETYKLMYQAYRRIFERCGLRFSVVEADTGAIGGSFSHEFMVLANSGEEQIVSCPSCGYAANLERTESLSPDSISYQQVEEGVSDNLLNLEKVSTPNVKTVEEVCGFMDSQPQELVKTLIIMADGEPVLALLRGDHEINLNKLQKLLGAKDLELASPETIERVTQAPVGFAGPVSVTGYRLIADLVTKGMRNFIAGANENDAHYRGVNWGRDAEPEQFADLRLSKTGDLCCRCRSALTFSRGIEVGHIFKLGTKYSEALGATYLDDQSKKRALVMGCYGIGVSRTMAAAIEQSYDRYGIIWPVALAPFQVIVLMVDPLDEQVRDIAVHMANSLKAAGLEALLDDRDERPGIKFKDSDLIGVPLRVTVGVRDLKSGVVEIKARKTGQSCKVSPEHALEKVLELLKGLQAE